MTEPLLLPAPERYKDWRVLSEGEKQGEATGEEVLVKERENRLCFVPIPKYGLFLEAFETVIVPPDYGNNGCGFGDIREFDPNCMDFETWAKAAIDRGLVLRAKMGEGFEGEGDIIKYASRFNWITVGYCIRNTHNNRHGNHISIPPHGLYKWTAITRAEYEQETKKEPERNADVPVRFDPKCMDAHIFARAAIGAGDMLKVTDGNKTRWCNSCDSVSVWHNRAQYSYPYFAWNDLLVERKTRAEYEQETKKAPAMPITHIRCMVEGQGNDVWMSIAEVRRQMEGVA